MTVAGWGGELAVYHVDFFLEERVFEKLYTEIERMRPVFQFLLAPQTGRKNKEGMASLRQAVATVATPVRKPQGELDEYAKKFYEWLDPGKRSTIRLCIHWQAGFM